MRTGTQRKAKHRGGTRRSGGKPSITAAKRMAARREENPAPSGSSAAEDSRFAEVVAALSTDPAFAAVVAGYRADLASGSRKFGAGGLKVNGKLFAMISKGRLVVKLPRQRVEDLVAAHKGVPFDPGHGRKMKEWLALDGTALPWVELAREAHAFVGGART